MGRISSNSENSVSSTSTPEFVEQWFNGCVDPPRFIWKEALHKLKGYKVEAGYYHDKASFCWVRVTEATTGKALYLEK